MRGNVVADVDAYGADFPFTHPDTGVFRYPVALDTQKQQQFDYGFLQFPYVFARAKMVLFKTEDGVADKLSRTMTGNTAPPVGVENGYSLFSERLRRDGHILFSPEPPYGENRRVLQEQQYIANSALRPGLG
jgi:hypothetical protein